MGEFFFEPADVTLPRDAIVNLENVGQVVHTWILREAGVGTAAVRPGQSARLDLEDVPPGRYTVYCDQMGHTRPARSAR